MKTIIKFLIWIKHQYLCLIGFHGFNNKIDCKNNKCSFCGCHFEGYLKIEKNS